jgi:hypothetical protein
VQDSGEGRNQTRLQEPAATAWSPPTPRTLPKTLRNSYQVKPPVEAGAERQDDWPATRSSHMFGTYYIRFKILTIS